ncbi:DUF1501 domain-containing protein [Aggregicoccus sp. 17bor-14]|uniref:DUF1501 domain-containing protein n=1 Tax=Myxococcaceae TaxID=31 RepID=UPI00129C8ACF|nr:MULTISPECIES: DUF1501 domain-containing protein [Myxococcaceae]MBF5043790.1 DUF1501 domain-containing protein [Simulacricoccus sp. 17bor-14]MRI89543.1 DUF1501 domain-containing protein [Aggregicoccus sp. 17bor-14]
MPLSRRDLLRTLALAGAGGALLPSFLQRALAQAGPARRALVTVFLRGGADGLSLVPPVGDAAYHRARPSLALPERGEGAALRLDGVFGLHPGLAPLMPLWGEGRLALVHGVGLPVPVRSHFDAQDFVESGTPGRKATPDGWMNRALALAPAPGGSPLRAVALQPTLPRALLGEVDALALADLEGFRVRAGARSEQAGAGFAALYAGAVDAALRSTGADAARALQSLGASAFAERPPEHGAEYPRSALGRRLQDVARLLRADVGLEVAATEMTGWDTHVQQGGAQGAFARRCEELAGALAAFAQDLGPLLERVVVVVLTEFGRTVRENGSHGTDHGFGSAMLALGGGVRGGRVHGRFEPLEEARLQDGRDVPAWTDHRTVLGEALAASRPGVDLARVFPGFTPAAPLGLWG